MRRDRVHRLRRGTLLAALAAGLTLPLVTGGSASATVARCDHGTCIKVIGKGLHVSDVMVSTEYGHKRAGYYWAAVRYGGTNQEWVWTDWIDRPTTVYMRQLSGRDYPNGVYICAGVETQQIPMDYADEICIQVHR
ncbi:hypothetical protein [Kitasatospora purpeofusca]|uniref:hypothetical protein n=1 Tax=Kitasatospora purpeofusca TaxID=67352 RepID=UPI0036C75D53